MRKGLVRVRSGDWDLQGERLELHHARSQSAGGWGGVPLALLAHDNCDDDEREDEADRERNRYGPSTLLEV